MENQLTAVGAYIFAGGFSFGIQRAGFKVLAHLEASEYGVATSKRNLRVPVHIGMPPTELQGLAYPDLVYANPPCAPWSSAGSKRSSDGARNYDLGYDPRDERVGCVRNVMSLLRILKPKVLAWESVRRAWVAGETFLRELAADANGLGYHVYVVLHNGYDCGLPQNRRRMFFVATKVEIPWAKPKPPEGAPRTVRQAFSSMCNYMGEDIVQRTNPAWMPALSRCGGGDKLVQVFNEMNGTKGIKGVTGRPGFLHQRLSWDLPAPTCLSQAGTTLYHPEIDRAVSLREFQVLCGYPVDYEFEGSNTMRYRQVSQAVLPPVGEWLGNTVRFALEAPIGWQNQPGLEVVDLE